MRKGLEIDLPLMLRFAHAPILGVRIEDGCGRGIDLNYSITIESKLPASSHSQGWAEGISVIDFNGDGKLDIVAAFNDYPSWSAVPLRVFLGDGQGRFTDGTSASLANPPLTIAPSPPLMVADFNGDGRLDFYVPDFGPDAVGRFVGAQGALVLSGPNGYADATNNLPQLKAIAHSAAVGDIDGDGDKDLYVGSIGVENPYFAVNDGKGNFTLDRSGLPSQVRDLNQERFTASTLLDIDKDGDVDLVLGTMHGDDEVGRTNRILLNDGKGHFSPTALPTAFEGHDVAVVDIDVLDLNNDGHLDIVFNYAFDKYEGNYAQFLIGSATGFSDQTATWMPTNLSKGAARLHFVDMNQDGLVDIVQSRGTESPLLLNTGSNSFVRMPGIFSGSFWDFRNVGDVNGDGRPDIAHEVSVRDGQYHVVVDLSVDAGIVQNGTDSAEAFMGDADSENLSGNGGPDTIIAGLGDDTVNGGDGNDTVYAGAGSDIVQGDSGNDFLRGNEGNDRIVGGEGNDDTHGNQGNDTVSGGLGDDWVVGGKDDDLLDGGDGFDVVYGNIGNDWLDGGAGNDWIRGGQNDDVLLGQAGDDWMSGDKGNDTLTGGSGADLFNFSAGSFRDRVTDFSIAEGDRVRIEGGSPYTVRYEGSDTLVDLGNGDVMTLVGVNLTGTDWIA